MRNSGGKNAARKEPGIEEGLTGMSKQTDGKKWVWKFAFQSKDTGITVRCIPPVQGVLIGRVARRIGQFTLLIWCYSDSTFVPSILVNQQDTMPAQNQDKMKKRINKKTGLNLSKTTLSNLRADEMAEKAGGRNSYYYACHGHSVNCYSHGCTKRHTCATCVWVGKVKAT